MGPATQQRFFDHRAMPSQPEPVYEPYSEYDNSRDGVDPKHTGDGLESTQLRSVDLADQNRTLRGAGDFDGRYPVAFDERRSEDSLEQMKSLEVVDQRLKRHIRILRLVCRILAFVVSILVFVPITMTLVKYLQTRDVFRVVVNPSGDTQSRTAWARDTVTWPTYAYFGVAAVSLVLNLFIMISYLRTDVRTANRTAYVATTFSWIVLVGNAVVWAVAASLYRTEKKDTDLWGWACGDAAQGIQRVFEKEVDFNMYCNTQSFSWYAGVVQALLAILTCIVFYLMMRRKGTKKRLGAVDQRVLLAKT